MAAGAVTFYNIGLKNAIVDGDWSVDVKYMILVLATYTPALTHTTYADVSSYLCVDSDYTTMLITDRDLKTMTDAEAAGTVTLDAANISYGAAVTITAKYAVILHGDATTPVAGDAIIAYIDLNTGGGSVSSSAGPFDVNFNAAGVATVAAA